MPDIDQPSSQAALAKAIREELARRRMSRAELAAQSRISLSSLEKALSGQRPFTEQTVIRIEDALKIRLRAAKATGHVAPEWLGSYARPAVKWLEGAYLTIRPAASDAACLYAYLTEIGWDAAQSHLTFRETGRVDGAYAQAGAVSVPHQTGHIYLVTSKHGQYRMAVLSRPSINGEMFGVLTTLQTGRGSQLVPVATPLVLMLISADQPKPALGTITPDHQVYSSYCTLLDRATAEDFVRLTRLEPAPPVPH